MIVAGFGLAPQTSRVMESLVLEGSLFTVIGLVSFWLLVSCLVRCATSVAILSAAALTTLSVETAAVTYLTN